MPRMNKRLLKHYVSAFTCLVTMLYFVPGVMAQSAPLEILPKLVLSELQTGGLTAVGSEDGRQEFIELYNPNIHSLDVTDWRIEYLSASHNGTGAATRTLAILEGEIASADYAILSFEAFIPDADVYFGVGSTSTSGLLARSGGHVRIVDAEGSTIDLLGWGTGVAIGKWWKVPEISAGSSVQRILPGHELYGASVGFAAPNNIPTPRPGGLRTPSVVPPDSPVCSGLILSELLPNPTGMDEGREFIEIHNPTSESVRLKGCSLRLGETGKVFAFPDQVLQPMGYLAFTDSDTGMTLPNATPQRVWLLSTDREESVIYGADLADNVSWALFDGVWSVSTSPSPGLPNIITLPPPDESDEGTVLASRVPCSEGKERNPATGRCRALETTSEPTPCKPGQVRNPETNRCRAVVATAGLAPCRTDQERNLETNRCRSIAGSASNGALQPCEEGQERNPDTNRCRKIQAASSLPKVEDIATADSAVSSRLWIGGLLAAAALGYAIYEWRQDIIQASSRLKQRLARRRKRSGRK